LIDHVGIVKKPGGTIRSVGFYGFRRALTLIAGANVNWLSAVIEG
jgi:hypothetical protein